jgi:hypothetical protein
MSPLPFAFHSTGVFPAFRVCLAFFCLGSMGGAFAATSSIVGFYPVDVPAGNSAWVCGLVGADLFSAEAVSVTADVDGKALVAFSAPGWTEGAFDLHYAEPQSGSGAGLAIDILSNTTTTLKLDSTPAAAGLTSGMTFIVRKHATLAGLLPDGGGLTPFGDTISLFGSNGLQTTYFFSNLSSTWITVLGADASNAIVRPGQGFVLQLGSAKTVTLGKGEICCLKTTATKIRVHANVPNIIGAMNPLGGATTTLGSLGVTTSLQAFNDSVVTLAPGTLAQTGTYLSTGASLINSGTGQTSDSTAIPAGAGVVINVNANKNITVAPVSVAP